MLHGSELVAGDIIQIVEGINIPCDGFIIRSSDVKTDESAMTGETDPVKKDTLERCLLKKAKYADDVDIGSSKIPSPIILSGTKIMIGEGLFIVIVVGEDSCVGKIRSTLQKEEEEETPLQQKLEIIARDIGYFGLISAMATVFALTVLFILHAVTQTEKFDWTNLKHILDYFIIGVAIVVMAIPEGLPLAVTLSLAFSVKKMLKDKNLVRKLQACETMGGADCICSDKTGTLTKNEMTLT